MNGDILENTNILIENDKITALDTDITIPESARLIDAKGLTAMPGLVDMHVHRSTEREGKLYIANGVTAVRNMNGTHDILRLRHAAERGLYIGPQIYTTGPLLDGPSPRRRVSIQIENAEQARGAVRTQKAAGYEAVKLYERLSPEAFTAAVEEARKLDMQIYSHRPNKMAMEDFLKLQVDSLEHLEEAEAYLVSDDYKPTFEKLNYLTAWASADPIKMKRLADLFAKYNVANSATLEVAIGRFEASLNADAWFESPLAKYIDVNYKTWWTNFATRTVRRIDAPTVAVARVKQLEFIATLYNAGAPLLVGTDTPNPFIVPGFSIHDEIDRFIAAGIPVQEVLQIATKGAATFLRAEDTFGAIAVGLNASIILVKGDPIAQPSLLRQPAYVINQGRIYDRQALDLMLKEVREEIALSYTSVE